MGAAYFGIIPGIFEVIMRIRQSGFTLIEIMVVVVILAVLGALVVPKILENVDKARVTRAQSDIRAIQTALEKYSLFKILIYTHTHTTRREVPGDACTERYSCHSNGAGYVSPG